MSIDPPTIASTTLSGMEDSVSEEYHDNHLNIQISYYPKLTEKHSQAEEVLTKKEKDAKNLKVENEKQGPVDKDYGVSSYVGSGQLNGNISFTDRFPDIARFIAPTLKKIIP